MGRKVPTSTRRRILRRDGLTCQLCGTTTAALVVDHIIPTSQGGRDDDDNLRSLCERCHEPKSKRERVAGFERKMARRRLPVGRHPGLI